MKLSSVNNCWASIMLNFPSKKGHKKILQVYINPLTGNLEGKVFLVEKNISSKDSITNIIANYPGISWIAKDKDKYFAYNPYIGSKLIEDLDTAIKYSLQRV